MTTLRFLGHSCFQLYNDNDSLIFDPFLKDNPFQIAQFSDISCNYILVSHGHFDHLGDAIAIAKNTGATIVSTAEIANLVKGEGCNAHTMHLGGKKAFDFGYVRVTLAFHGSGVPGGHACGFVVNFHGTTVYFAGDTGLFSDMALLGRLESIDYALLPIGDNFTMGPGDAIEAADMLKAKTVIPMHYDTWPLIAQSPEAYKEAVEARVIGTKVQILAPGQELVIS